MAKNDEVDICPNCGNRCSIDDVTCPKCGKNLDELFEQLEGGPTSNKGGETSSVVDNEPNHMADPIPTVVVWDTAAASLFGATKLNLKLASNHAILMDDGGYKEKMRIAKNKAHFRIKFLDKHFVGTDKTQHLDNLNLIQMSSSELSGISTLAIDAESLNVLKDWMPPLTSEIKQKMNFRGQAGFFFMLGAGQLGLFGFANLIGGVACLFLAAVNFLGAHRVLHLLNGAVLVIVGAMNIFMGGLLPILLGIVSLLWGIGEMWNYWGKKKVDSSS